MIKHPILKNRINNDKRTPKMRALLSKSYLEIVILIIKI